uniref:Uncharacterized protein n=1 Tax=Schizaphis graminum TaxID=13262 RepID=A0A2S2PQF5_SCHGA
MCNRARQYIARRGLMFDLNYCGRFLFFFLPPAAYRRRRTSRETNGDRRLITLAVFQSLSGSFSKQIAVFAIFRGWRVNVYCERGRAEFKHRHCSITMVPVLMIYFVDNCV